MFLPQMTCLTLPVLCYVPAVCDSHVGGAQQTSACRSLWGDLILGLRAAPLTPPSLRSWLRVGHLCLVLMGGASKKETHSPTDRYSRAALTCS